MIDSEFERAQVEVKQLPRTPTNDELLELYAWFKQATVGDNRGKRPGMLDLKGRAKFDAWARRSNTPTDVAKQEYVALVARLKSKYH